MAVSRLQDVTGDAEAALLREIARLRDEMIERRRGPTGGDEPGGVREPRRPFPGGGAAAAAVDPED